jgi:hypothetical protein
MDEWAPLGAGLSEEANLEIGEPGVGGFADLGGADN